MGLEDLYREGSSDGAGTQPNASAEALSCSQFNLSSHSRLLSLSLLSEELPLADSPSLAFKHRCAWPLTCQLPLAGLAPTTNSRSTPSLQLLVSFSMPSSCLLPLFSQRPRQKGGSQREKEKAGPGEKKEKIGWAQTKRRRREKKEGRAGLHLARFHCFFF